MYKLTKQQQEYKDLMIDLEVAYEKVKRAQPDRDPWLPTIYQLCLVLQDIHKRLEKLEGDTDAS